ncbi:MAG: hypothetical protein ABIR79_14790 [Candidatus Binatia bacterium]
MSSEPARSPIPSGPTTPWPWAALAGALLVLVGLQLATPNLVGNDSYFHIKYAEVMRQAGVRGFPPAFPWLPLTILAPDRYADHHLLYHVLLTPFTLGDLRIGGKIAAVAGAFAMVLAFVWVLRREGVVPLGFAVLALGASSADLLFRLSMTRVQAFSLVCLLVGFHLALAHRHVALAVLACVYAWLYDGFPLLFVPIGAVIAAEIVTERRLRPGIVVAAAVGMAVGLVVNPYFPDYLTFMWQHMGDKLVEREPLRVGKEWAPYDPLGLLANAAASMAFMAYGVAVLGEGRWKKERAALAALGVAVVFFALLLRSQRFVEYFAPLATFFVALAGGGTIAALDRTRQRVLALLLTAVLVANVVGIGSMLARRGSKTPYDRYAAAAELVAREAPPGAMLCTTDWDDFPWLYFYNVESTYLIGLDPTYLRNRFREAYWAWVDASLGKMPRPSDVFARRLPCAYVMSDRDHGGFLDLAATDPLLEQILTNDQLVLFRVKRDGPPPLHPTSPE